MKTQKKYESTKPAASYSQSLSKSMSLQHEFKFHVDEFEFHSGIPMSSELSEPRPEKELFKQDAASRYFYTSRDDSSVCTTMSLLICKTLMKLLLTVLSLAYKCSPLLDSLAQGLQTQPQGRALLLQQCTVGSTQQHKTLISLFCLWKKSP